MTANMRHVWGRVIELPRYAYTVFWRRITPDGTPMTVRSRKTFGREHKAETFIVTLMHAAESGFVVPSSVELVQNAPTDEDITGDE